jgi:predicted nucleic acid-binding protein
VAPEFVDTNILAYAHDGGAGAKYKGAQALIARLDQESSGALSTQILIEFYNVAINKLAIKSEEAAEIVADFSGWILHRFALSDLLDAAQIHRRYKISWWDALVLQSAQALGCETLWTEDLTHGQRYGPVTVRNPFK